MQMRGCVRWFTSRKILLSLSRNVKPLLTLSWLALLS